MLRCSFLVTVHLLITHLRWRLLAIQRHHIRLPAAIRFPIVRTYSSSMSGFPPLVATYSLSNDTLNLTIPDRAEDLQTSQSLTTSRLTSRRSQPPLALAVPLSRFTSRVGGGSAFFVRRHETRCHISCACCGCYYLRWMQSHLYQHRRREPRQRNGWF